ncbi:dCMP deaminase [Candidatus Uhrbacteria bacterium]|nr:dCMP deaminase [Candidatus Uhrbacteria bacterium]MBD3284186.1 dCMP deaminase [Candidatus Uhrbacteria bacterium]
MQRPSWDDYFMSMARLIATRATCDRAYVGALIVKDKRIISTGYNGAPPGLDHCHDAGHLMEEGHCIRTLHAEENAILQVAVTGGSSTQGATLYTTHSPCYHCAKKIIMAGIQRVVVGVHYPNTLPINDAFKDAGVEIEFYERNKEWDDHVIKLFGLTFGEKLS